jgi:hypothetical protein
VQQGSRKRAVEGTLTLGDPPKVSFAVPERDAGEALIWQSNGSIKWPPDTMKAWLYLKLLPR